MTSNHPLRVVMFAAEASPYAKVGGLGDVVGALPKALEKLGAGLTVVIPAYKTTLNAFDVARCRSVPGFDVPVATSIERAKVFQTRMEGSGVDVYLIGSRKYFDRAAIYDDPATREGYPDNIERFIFFMKSGLELLVRLGTPVDIIHCHDSQTALIPGLLRTNYRDSPFFAPAGTLFTIHNLAYQGLYSKEAMDYAGIDSSHFRPGSPFEFWGQVNLMKAGIALADKISTVSQTYAAEIQTGPELGLGLEGVLQSRKEDVSGIVNGIDCDEWNPEIDPFIPSHFSARDFSGKNECKAALLRYFALPQSRKRVPLIGMVSRLAEQKGLDLIAEAIESMMALDLQLVVLGTGQQKYHDLLRRMASRYPEKMGIRLSYDNELAHRIEAGCDMFLMPSKYEPCGLSQLISFRYGTVPIVRRTGGLADTVVPYGDGVGTGFSFAEYSAAGMMEAIRQALAVYADPARWRPLRIRAMCQDWSWDRSASQYLQLYRSIHSKKHPGASSV